MVASQPINLLQGRKGITTDIKGTVERNVAPQTSIEISASICPTLAGNDIDIGRRRERTNHNSVGTLIERHVYVISHLHDLRIGIDEVASA